MLLSISERVLLLSILPPAEGNAYLLRAVRRLRKDVSFTDEEILQWKIANPSQGVFTFDKTVAPVEISVTDVAHQYLSDCLKSAESGGRLHEDLLGVYDQFFPEE